ncbi:hypothetical protein J6590_027619 [Homalodisca vitripennis]|nr:hypothetical protein J6590_027619 [Homalodisca vitripennis]
MTVLHLDSSRVVGPECRCFPQLLSSRAGSSHKWVNVSRQTQGPRNHGHSRTAWTGKGKAATQGLGYLIWVAELRPPVRQVHHTRSSNHPTLA